MIRVAARPRQPEHPTRDGRRPLAGLENSRECPLAIGRIRIAQAELGIVEDRRQRIVELVEHTAGKDAETADPLKRDDLPPQCLDLLATAGDFGTRGRREYPGRAARSWGSRGRLRVSRG